MSILREGDIVRDTYEVERLMGEGAFAEVYRVRHRFMGPHWEAWWQSIFSIPRARRQTLQFIEKTGTILLEAAATPVEQQICDIARERREILSRTLASGR